MKINAGKEKRHCFSLPVFLLTLHYSIKNGIEKQSIKKKIFGIYSIMINFLI